MEEDSRDLRQHLADEQRYARHHFKRLGKLQQQLHEEMLDSTETHTVSNTAISLPKPHLHCVYMLTAPTAVHCTSSACAYLVQQET